MSRFKVYIDEQKNNVARILNKPYLSRIPKEAIANQFKLVVGGQSSASTNVEIGGYKTYETNLGAMKFLQVKVTTVEDCFGYFDLPEKRDTVYNFLVSNYEIVQYEIVQKETEKSKVNYEEPLYGDVFRGIKPHKDTVLKAIVDGKKLGSDKILMMQKTMLFAQDGYVKDWKIYNHAKENIRHEIIKNNSKTAGEIDSEESETHNKNSTNIKNCTQSSSYLLQFVDSTKAEEKEHE